MVNNRSLVIIAVLAVLAWLASTSLYVVNETQRAIKLRFGEVVATDIAPGLHAKWPLINTVHTFDARVQTLENGQSRFLTAGRNALIVDSFLKWRVVDPTRFYQATRGNTARAEALISPRVEQSLRNAFGSREVNTIISEDRDDMLADSMESLDKAMRNEIGVEILDIRLKRVELPEQVTQAVYQRMSTERHAEARQYRAQGQEQSERIRAHADRQREIALANARKEADRLRGEGDGEAANIYANAYKQEPEFARFYRSMQAYRKSFEGNNDILVIGPKSDFFRYLEHPSGGASQ